MVTNNKFYKLFSECGLKGIKEFSKAKNLRHCVSGSSFFVSSLCLIYKMFCNYNVVNFNAK